MVYNNKKVADIEEIIDFLNASTNKKCLINISIEYYGLYIYSDTTSNKWVIKTLDITNIDDEDSIISIDELIDNYRERISNIKKRSDDKLLQLSDNIEIINKNIASIHNLSELLKSKDTTNKVNINNHLIKLNELILKQEEVLKNSN
jgi:CRISPR/Cas system CMR-associated protein Cmr3 (group 5 of RAMP superfamily)